MKHEPGYGPRTPIGEARTCKRCTRAIDPSERAHVCRACRVRKSRGAEVGERCGACEETDRRVLCLRRLTDCAATLCGSCAVLLGRRPLSLQELRAERSARPVAA